MSVILYRASCNFKSTLIDEVLDSEESEKKNYTCKLKSRVSVNNNFLQYLHIVVNRFIANIEILKSPSKVHKSARVQQVYSNLTE